MVVQVEVPAGVAGPPVSVQTAVSVVLDVHLVAVFVHVSAEPVALEVVRGDHRCEKDNDESGELKHEWKIRMLDVNFLYGNYMCSLR